MSETKLSAYFKIFREADDPSKEREYESEVSFELKLVKEDGKPEKLRLVKLGDGSYGSVYLGRAKDGSSVAIKVLYNNNETQARQIRELSEGELGQLLHPIVEKYDLYKRKQDEKENTQNKEQSILLFVSTVKTHRNSDSTLRDELRKVYENLRQSATSAEEFNTFWDALTQEASSSAFARFEKERSITTYLRRSLRQESDGSQWEIPNIVEVKGGCNNFQKILADNPEGFREVTAYFTEEEISYSDYVLVTKRYHYSLKDLLERTDGERQENGYAVLKSLPHNLRVREALLITKQVAFGLAKLHNVHNPAGKPKSAYHRDIKPANVFILRKADDMIEAALGDLGNLPTDETEYLGNFSFWGLAGYMPPDYAPGTRHYRSPEQKYYRDVADVRVVLLPEDDLTENVQKILKGDRVNVDQQNEPKGTKTVLIVTDPKFQNTLIEEGDLVYFSKVNKREPYLIEMCISPDSEKSPKNRTGNIAYVLSTPRDKKDEKTQIEFYKRQRHRTDLFGIGALLVDMITAGSSPEQFYENIRKYEVDTIKRNIGRYNALRGGLVGGENPDFAVIFKPFRNDTDRTNPYPETDIIELILKCMLYQSAGTFYQVAGNEPHKASEYLHSEINRLLGVYQEGSGIPANTSILMHHYKKSDSAQLGPDMPFHQRIEELQGLLAEIDDRQPATENISATVVNLPDPAAPSSGQPEISQVVIKAANRLMFGAYYFRGLTDFIQQNILLRNNTNQGQTTTEPSIRQILPTFITLRWDDPQRMSPVTFSATAAPAISPEGDLKQNRLELLIRSATNAFVPNEVVSMQRELRLYPSVGKPSDNVSTYCTYLFLDAAIVNRSVEPGDWIAVGNQLWQITHHSPAVKELVLKLIEPEKSPTSLFKDDEDQPRSHVDAIYFSRIEPLKYYFDMLALYLQHLLFTYSPITTTTRDRIDLAALLRTFEIPPNFTINDFDLRFKREPDSNNKIREIYEQFIYMFLKLTLHEASGSYYKESVADDKWKGHLNFTMLNQVCAQASKLYDEVYALLKKPVGSKNLHPQPFTSPEQLYEQVERSEFEGWVEELQSDPIDMEKFLKRSGLIEGSSR